MSSGFRNWLTLWAWGLIAFGAVIAGAGFAASAGPVSAIMEAIAPGAIVWDAPMRFATGLMGAVTMGWGLTFIAFFQLSQSVEQPDRAWRTMMVGFTLWYVVDSAISIGTGFWLNAVSNTALYILLLIPVLRSGVLSADRRLPAG